MKSLYEFLEEEDLCNALADSHRQFAMVGAATPEIRASLFESGCITYFSSDDTSIFSYLPSSPPRGIPINKLTQESAINLIKVASRLNEDASDENGAAEIAEINPRQFDILKAVKAGEQVSPDGDTEWLVEIGMLSSNGGYFNLSQVAKEWLNAA